MKIFLFRYTLIVLIYALYQEFDQDILYFFLCIDSCCNDGDFDGLIYDIKVPL